MSLTNKLLSGIEFAQDVATATSILSASVLYQEFYLPSDIERGTRAGEIRIPELTGFSVLLDVPIGERDTIVLDWVLEREVFGVGWIPVAEGQTIGAQDEGARVWFDVYFDNLVTVDPAALTDRFRIGVSTLTTSVEIWGAPATGYPIAIEGRSLTFRILTASGDGGTDFLGNTYRGAIFSHTVANLSGGGGAGASNTYWFSKPNPSRFAIENLYFDISEVGSESAVDSILIDPITPDVYFHVYYTSEGAPGITPADWDGKLWTRVPKTFQAKARETHVLPEPVAAKYMKIEFSHLQPKPYSPGPFQQPILYQKHPKWVLDYFLARVAEEAKVSSRFVASRVEVRYNALNLAYNYYLDDLKQEPNQPVQLNTSTTDLKSFLQDRTDVSDQVDAATAQKITTILNPYALGSGGFSGFATDGENGLQAFELPSTFAPNSTVSSLNRDAVVFEQSYPVMFYYLTCRHRYREVSAVLSHERAYFVGIRQIAFLRERYSKATDTNLYVEIGGDTVNLAASDFVRDNNSLVIDSG